MQTHPNPAAGSETSFAVFRDAQKEDIRTLVDLENKCFHQYRLSQRNFSYLINRGNCDVIIVEKDHQKIGYAISLYRKHSTEVRIYSIAIHSDFRGLNLGKFLLQEIKRKAILKGCKQIRLEVDSSNFVAVRFYEKQGFKKYRIVRDYYGPNKHAIQYRKVMAL